jgi:type IV secretory pathway VirB10-like protein
MFAQKPKDIVQTNRVPFLAGTAVLLLAVGMFMFKSQKNQKAAAAQSRPRQSMDVSMKTGEAGWFNDEKFKNIKINAAQTRKPAAKEIEAAVISNQELDFRKQEILEEFATRLEIERIENKARIANKKLELEAAKSPLPIETPPVPGTKAAPKEKGSDKDALTGRLNTLADMVRSAAVSRLPDLAALGGQLAANFNNQDGKQEFIKSAQSDDDYLEKPKTKPRSPYEVKAGSTIPAALITGINSDLPGSVNAQVTENVYDSTTGNYLLIPQGAKITGEYNSNLTFGQKRVQVVWNRIIFPDGMSIDLDKMQGVDAGGHTGFEDKVDNHYLRIYGNAVLLSLMGAGYDILNNKAAQSTDPRETVAASVGQKLADVSGRTIEKNMDVQPTIIIDPGYKFKIMVMKDMVLENIKDAQGTLSYSK